MYEIPLQIPAILYHNFLDTISRLSNQILSSHINVSNNIRVFFFIFTNHFMIGNNANILLVRRLQKNRPNFSGVKKCLIFLVVQL